MIRKDPDLDGSCLVGQVSTAGLLLVNLAVVSVEVPTRNQRHRGVHHLYEPKPHLSNEKNLGWLFDIGDYTTQLYRDYNKPI